MSTEVKDSPAQSALFTLFVLCGPHFSSQQVSQLANSPSTQPVSRFLKLGQQAVAVRVG